MQDILTVRRGEDPFPVCTIGDVAQRSGCKVDTVNHWVQRQLGTPEPIGRCAAGALYWWPDWIIWLAAKRPQVLFSMQQVKPIGNISTSNFVRG